MASVGAFAAGANVESAIVESVHTQNTISNEQVALKSAHALASVVYTSYRNTQEKGNT